MKVRFRLGALLVAMAATVLALASPALAKGGGGGTVTPGCAYISSWTTSVETVDARSMAVLRVGVFNGCVDEGAGAGKMPAVSLTSTDTATGKWLGASVNVANYGLNTFTYSFTPTPTPPAVTETLTVTRANGQLQDSRSATLAEILQSAQAA